MTKYVVGLAIVATSFFIAAFYSAPNTQRKEPIDVASNNTQHGKLNANKTAVTQPAGRVAYIDPNTGELSSTLPAGAQQRTNANNTNRAATVNLPPVEMTTHANGVVQAKLNGRFRTPLVATINCNGKIDTQHTQYHSGSEQECEAENK